MIGQASVLNFINDCIDNNKLPKFIVIRGAKGSGKKELSKYIAQKSGFELVYFNSSVDAVRQLINLCYQQTKPIIYIIPDAEKLSANAENALLKVAEEPPKNAFIILTVNDDSLLPTIKSRATLIVMNEYSYEDKYRFVTEILKLNNVQELDTKLDISDTPGDIINIINSDYKTIDKYCENIIKFIGQANIGSALKIGKKVKTKEKDEEDDSLFNLSLFMRILLYKYYIICINIQQDSAKYNHYFSCWKIVFDANKQLQKNLNKQYIIDEMILKLREINNAVTRSC